MAKLISVWWRDIPSHVVAKRGRESVKVQLPVRFMTAIDRAAMRVGKGSSHQYLEDWRRESRPCGSDLKAEAQAQAARLEAAIDEAHLERLVKAGGKSVSPQ